MAFEESDGALPCELGRRLVVSGRRVVVEAVPGSGIAVHFEPGVAGLERRFVSRAGSVDPPIVFGVVDQQRGPNLGHVVRLRGAADEEQADPSRSELVDDLDRGRDGRHVRTEPRHDTGDRPQRTGRSFASLRSRRLKFIDRPLCLRSVAAADSLLDLLHERDRRSQRRTDLETLDGEQHGPSAHQEHDNDGDQGEDVVLPGLGVRPRRAIHLVVE